MAKESSTEFGMSLLGNISARNRETEARYRRESKTSIWDGLKYKLAGQALEGGLGVVSGALTSARDNANIDFLQKSKLYDNQILMDNTTLLVSKRIADAAAAKEAGKSLTEHYAYDKALDEFAKAKVARPAQYKSGTDSHWIAGFMELESVQKDARNQAAFAQTVIDKSKDFISGKASGNTLAHLAKLQKRSTGRVAWDNVTGKVTTADAFNASMAGLKQVKIANELYNLSPERIKRAQAVVAKTGSSVAGHSVLGINFTDEQRKKIEANIKLGQTTDYETTYGATANGQVQARTITTVRDVSGNIVRKPTLTTQNLGGPKGADPMTPAELTKVIETQHKIFDRVSANVTDQGEEDFYAAVAQNGLLKKNMTAEDYIDLAIFAVDYENYTTVENFTPAMSEVEAELIMAGLEGAKVDIASLSLDLTDDERSAAIANILNSVTAFKGRKVTPNVTQKPRTPVDGDIVNRGGKTYKFNGATKDWVQQ
jgi:hypothetical protein